VTARLCAVAGCTRPGVARGWCFTHYRRNARTGDVHANKPVAGPRGQCSIPGCEAPHKARSYCEPHYRRFLKHGNPLAPNQHSQRRTLP
jgi:hypothetical protein